MLKQVFIFAILLLSIFGLGCYFDSGNESTTTPGEFVSFETDVVAILSAECATSGCHTGATPQGGLNLDINDSDAATLYEAVSAQIDVDDPEASLLLMKASNTTPHTGGEVLATSSDDYQTILAWITGGAFNDNCDGIDHGFAADVTPIFSNCTTAGCHDTTDPILSTDPYQNIQDAGAVDTDSPSESSLLRKPLGLDDHGGGAVFSDVNDEDYKTIFCWIKVDNAIDN